MSGKIISVGDLKQWDVFCSGGYEYVFMGFDRCWNKHTNCITNMGTAVEVEYIGSMNFKPYIPPDWRNLLCPSNVDYDNVVQLLDDNDIEWRPYPRGLFARKVVQVKEDNYKYAQILRDKCKVDSGLFAPGTK